MGKFKESQEVVDAGIILVETIVDSLADGFQVSDVVDIGGALMSAEFRAGLADIRAVKAEFEQPGLEASDIVELLEHSLAKVKDKLRERGD